MTNEKKKLIIIDSNAILHRAFHALPPLTTKKGEMVNAVYGFLLVLFKVIKELEPGYITACFDFPALTFRHERYKEYKAKRPPTPKDLSRQIPIIKEILKGFGIPIFEKEGYEADDIIGTISHLTTKEKTSSEIEVIILSGDLDVLQLVDARTKVFFLKRGVKETTLYDENLTKEKYPGLIPEQLLDLRALRGDPSDNIPGVKGVGEKTAIELIKEFGTLENLYKELEKNSEKAKTIKEKVREKLLDDKERAFLSKEIAEIKKDLVIDFSLKESRWREFDREKIVQLLKKLDFYSLIERLPNPQDKTIPSSSGAQQSQLNLS